MPKKDLKLVSVDPSLTATGIGFFQNEHLKNVYLIKPKKEKEIRLFEIAIRFRAFLNRFKPEVLAIETQYIAIRSSSVIKVIEVKGIIEGIYLSYCLEYDIKPQIIEVSPTEAKSAIGVKGRLTRKDSKEAVKKMVLMFYPELKNQPQDIYDAIAIGICGLSKYKLNNILTIDSYEK